MYQPSGLTPTNQQIISEYLRSKRNSWRPNTQRVREMQLNNVARSLGNTYLLATEDDLMAWHSGLRGTPETIASYVSSVAGLYRWLVVRRRLRTDDPSRLLERPPIPEAPPRPMSEQHWDLALACALHDPELYVWLGLMGCSGLRCCEIAWLRTYDVRERSDGRGLATFEGKGGKRRAMPLGVTVMQALKPFLFGQGTVFTRPSDGLAYTPDNVSRKMNVFLRGIGIPDTAHSLRHLFGTEYHKLDPDMFRQAKLMGHASIETTQRYTLVDPAEAAEYVEKLTQQRMNRRRPSP